MKATNKLILNITTETIYHKVAKELGVTPRYVGKIARNERCPKRGNGLKVKQRLEEIAGELNTDISA